MLDRNALEAEIARLLRQPSARMDRTTLLTDLVTDSFELVELVIELQERFGVQLRQEDLKSVKTVGDLERLFASKTLE